jgi:hypothetical protein
MAPTRPVECQLDVAQVTWLVQEVDDVQPDGGARSAEVAENP